MPACAVARRMVRHGRGPRRRRVMLGERPEASGACVGHCRSQVRGPEQGNGDRRDIVNQPADLSFVADAVIDLARVQPLVLPAISDPARVAALGHSDGGLTVTAWAYDNQFRDRRVAATVVMAGGIGLFPGTYFAPDSPPLLAIHATGDRTNPYSSSVSLVQAM